MKILFAGTPDPAAVVLEKLIDDPRLEVIGVITQPDAKRGRGRTLRPSPVAKLATAHDIPVHKYASLKADTESGVLARQELETYREAGVEAIAVVAYGNLIPADLLNTVEHGWVNLHYSLLPRWRGAAPVQAAIAAGDDVTGATIFRIEEGLDTGPILATCQHTIDLRETADDLLSVLTYEGRELLADTLANLAEGNVNEVVQPDEGATHAGKIHSADARIDWTASAASIQRIARAHTPAPGAWTMLDGQRFKIGLMMPFDTSIDLATEEREAVDGLQPGQLWAKKNLVLVGTGQPAAALEIKEIQPPGKKMMSAADWARGQQQLLAESPIFEPKEQ